VKSAIVLIALISTMGCASFDLESEDLVLAAQRTCAVIDVLASEPDLVDPQDLKEALQACRIARALADLQTFPRAPIPGDPIDEPI
jgi:hypothetical protein